MDYIIEGDNLMATKWISRADTAFTAFREHLSLLKRFITPCPHIKTDDDVYGMEIEFNFKVRTYCQSCSGKRLEKELTKRS
jgi:hypothetical protein